MILKQYIIINLKISYMGLVASKMELIVTTINYSGILLSPFQFFSEDLWKEEEELSQCFEKLLQANIINFDKYTFKWGLGKIDKEMQKQRYSPLYNQQAGLENGKLIDQQKFCELWKSSFETNAPKLKEKPSAQEQKNCMKFDLTCYQAIVLYLYKITDLKQASKQDSSLYKKLMKKFFSKSFLNEKEKIKITLRAMEAEEVDIFLVQETTQQLLKSINSNVYATINSKNGNSSVILRRQKFRKIHSTQKILQNLPEELSKSLQWNNDTAICFVDNLIIFSIHLSSKKQKNAEQVKQMLKDLQKLGELYPMCYIVAGGDANSFIEQKNISKQYDIYPKSANDITTMKKRTWLQPQTNKACDLAASCRDHLISTVELQNPQVLTIRGTRSNKVKYIPNQEHPCDHFVVTATVSIYR